MTAVIFDLDGTLVDSAPDIHAAVNRLLAAEGEVPLSAATVRGFIGNGVQSLIARVLAACDKPADAALHARWEARFMADYALGASDLTRLYPGVIEALDELAMRGHAMALCTNKPETPARHVLRAFGLDRFFPVVIGGDSLPRRKPDPAPLHAAVLGLGAGRAVFVGDSEVDAETAQAAGLPLLLFTGGYRKSPVEAIRHATRFDHFDQLPGQVAGLIAL